MPAKRAAAAAQHAAPPSPSSSESEHDVGNAHGNERFFDTHYSQTFLASLPAKIRLRARVLLHYHDEYMVLQKEAEQAELALRRRYEALYEPLLQRRRDIIAGAAVSDEEVRRGYPAEHEGRVSLTADSIDDDDDEEAKKTKKAAVEAEEGTATAATATTAAAAEEKDSGLPGFWLRVLQHHVAFEHLIHPHDEPVLRNLTNISSHVTDGEYGSFDVVFTFAPNDYLVSEQLRLAVRLVEGATTVVRTAPVWRPGKNVTVRSVAQKQRSRRTGRTRTITREEAQPSFFTLFTEPSSDDDDDDDDDDAAAAGKKKGGRGGAAARRRHRNKDDDDDEDDDEDEDDDKDGDDTEQMVQMLQLLHMQIIPAAVEYYTGEAPDGSSDADDDDEEYDEDDEDEENDDSDE